jgi:hypothetical protein
MLEIITENFSSNIHIFSPRKRSFFGYQPRPMGCGICSGQKQQKLTITNKDLVKQLLHNNHTSYESVEFIVCGPTMNTRLWLSNKGKIPMTCKYFKPLEVQSFIEVCMQHRLHTDNSLWRQYIDICAVQIAGSNVVRLHTAADARTINMWKHLLSDEFDVPQGPFEAILVDGRVMHIQRQKM